eukprot:g10736.t1
MPLDVLLLPCCVHVVGTLLLLTLRNDRKVKVLLLGGLDVHQLIIFDFVFIDFPTTCIFVNSLHLVPPIGCIFFLFTFLQFAFLVVIVGLLRLYLVVVLGLLRLFIVDVVVGRLRLFHRRQRLAAQVHTARPEDIVQIYKK